jgi:hypothetical protein
MLLLINIIIFARLQLPTRRRDAAAICGEERRSQLAAAAPARCARWERSRRAARSGHNGAALSAQEAGGEPAEGGAVRAVAGTFYVFFIPNILLNTSLI